MAYLYGGNILMVDLNNGKLSKEPTSTYSGDFLGGRGINIKLLYDGVPPEVGALDPASLLILGVGPLCGTPVPASRVEVTAKSPETGFLGSSNFGGFFSPELKLAGYDHIVIRGKADRPVYLWIYNERVEIRDASHIWGKDTYETQEIIRSEVDPEAKVACIGQAGENLVHFATIQSELGHGAGRTGLGAVMGSKNLKAIVVRGTKAITLADPVKYLSVAQEVEQEIRSSPMLQEIHEHGMSKGIDMLHDLTWDPDWKFARSYALFEKYKPERTGCFGCPMQCMDLYPVGAKGGGAISCTFYEAIYPVRSTDVDVLLECGLWAQRYGVDVVSSMIIIAWVMILFEKGIITAKDTDGISMEWGSREAITGMFKKIVHREGFGDVLADGMLPAAERIGQRAKDYAYQVKGLPLYSSYTPNRLIPFKKQTLGLVVSSRGDTMRITESMQLNQVMQLLPLVYGEKRAAEYTVATQQRAKELTGFEKAHLPEEYEGKPELTVYGENIVIINDCLSACKLIHEFSEAGPFSPKYQAELFSAGSGIETSEEMLFELARKVRNLERAYCAREGMTRDTDSLPKSFIDHPIEQGDFKGSVLKSDKFEEMKDRYYALRGWDIATGIPTRETLEESGLSDVAKDLEKRGKLPNKSPEKKTK